MFIYKITNKINNKVYIGQSIRPIEKRFQRHINDALNNITPQLEVKARRIGGANYQVPVEVRAERKMTLCLRWLTQYSRLRKEKTMEERLANEIIDASNGIGGSVKRALWI